MTESRNTYPPAYIYEGMTIIGGVQQPPGAVNGYIHWSSLIYSARTRAALTRCSGPPAVGRRFNARALKKAVFRRPTPIRPTATVCPMTRGRGLWTSRRALCVYGERGDLSAE